MLFCRCIHQWYCLPSPLSWSDVTTSGWQAFPVNFFSVHLRPYNPFSIYVVTHIICCRPRSPPHTYPYLLYCISSTMLFLCYIHSQPCVPYLPPVSLLRSLSHYIPSFCVLCRCCFSTFSGQIFSFLYIILYFTACSALIHSNFLTLSSDILTTILFCILARIFYFPVMFLVYSDLPRFSPLAFTPLCSNLVTPLSSICSDLLYPYLICSTLIALLILWSTCSNLIGPARSYLLCRSSGFFDFSLKKLTIKLHITFS